METTYLNLDASYVTVWNEFEQKVSGGSRLCYTRVPRSKEYQTGANEKVVDLETYRRRLSATMEEVELPEEKKYDLEMIQKHASISQREKLSLLLDLCATAAILCATLCVVLRFFHII